jgi:hypothetical protein
MTTSSNLDDEQVAHLRSWEGRSETLTDEIVAAPLRGQSALLDRDDARQAAGSEVPPSRLLGELSPTSRSAPAPPVACSTSGPMRSASPLSPCVAVSTPRSTLTGSDRTE